MRFHTTLTYRIPHARITELGWNVLITMALIQLSKEEPRFKKLPPSPYVELAHRYNRTTTTGLAIFNRTMKESCEKWCESPSVGDVFDEFIIWQTGNLGLKIMLSEFVKERVVKWSSDPPKLDQHDRFLKACEVSIARIHVKRGNFRQPLTDPALYEGRKRTIPELDSIFRQIAKTSGSQRIPPGRDAVMEQFRSLASDCENVQSNLDSIAKFLTEDVGKCYLQSLLTGKTIRTAQFFDDWFSRCTGYSISYLHRKFFNELGPPRVSSHIVTSDRP